MKYAQSVKDIELSGNSMILIDRHPIRNDLSKAQCFWKRKYALYKKYHRIICMATAYLYTGKFVLSVPDLTQLELATEEDKSYGIDYWARLFKVETWEKLKMITKNDKYLIEASEILNSLHCNQTIPIFTFSYHSFISSQMKQHPFRLFQPLFEW